MNIIKPNDLSQKIKQFNQEYYSQENQERYLQFFKKDFFVKDQLDYNIKHNKTMFMMGRTQSQKTQAIFDLIRTMIESGNHYFDHIVIYSPNMTEALLQLHKRLKKYGHIRRIPVTNAKNLDGTTLGGTSIIQALKGKTDIPKVKDALLDDAKMRKEVGDEPAKILIFDDEGEIFDQENDDGNVTEKVMHDFKQSLKDEGIKCINTIKVSATLLFSILRYSKFHDLKEKPLQYRQIIELPLPAGYKGLGQPDFKIRAILKKDDKQLTMKNWKVDDVYDAPNLMNTLDYLDFQYSDKNGYQVPEWANIAFCRDIEGQKKTAGLIKQYWEDKAKGVAIINGSHVTTKGFTKKDITHGIILHNGDTTNSAVKEENSIDYKIRTMHNRYPNLQVGVIIGYQLLERSVTCDSGDYDNMYKPGHSLFGSYCNTSVIYDNYFTNIDLILQIMRCTGPRPPIKEHAVLCTPITEHDIQEYLDLEEQFLKRLQRRDFDEYPEEIESKIRPNRNYGTAEKSKMVKGPKTGKRGHRFKYSDWSKWADKEHVVVADHLVPVDQTIFDVLSKKDKTQELIDFFVKSYQAEVDPDYVKPTIGDCRTTSWSQYIGYQKENSIEPSIRGFSKGGGESYKLSVSTFYVDGIPCVYGFLTDIAKNAEQNQTNYIQRQFDIKKIYAKNPTTVVNGTYRYNNKQGLIIWNSGIDK